MLTKLSRRLPDSTTKQELIGVAVMALLLAAGFMIALVVVPPATPRVCEVALENAGRVFDTDLELMQAVEARGESTSRAQFADRDQAVARLQVELAERVADYQTTRDECLAAAR